MEKDIRNITPNNKFGGKELISANGLNMYDFGARLHITYDGNRIATVRDDADAVTQAGNMDYPGGASAMAFEYDSSGSLTKDESRGITSVEYDNFGNPVYIQIDGGYTKNVYSASGVKLKTTHYTKPYSSVLPGIQVAAVEPLGVIDPGDMQLQGQETLEYHGPVIYRNGKIDMVLFPGGYATISGTTVTFHYYTQDYLGNNRAVVNGTTGLIEQTTAYYPYGAVIPDLGTGNTGQPFKFGGKELISANGLNMYDFGARLQYPAVPHFTSIDPLSEKYAWLSPYLYCANNPVNAIDPDGEEWKLVKGPLMAFIWVPQQEARTEDGDLLPDHYEQAILFTATGKDGKTFDPDEENNIGSSTAVVYKADGTTVTFDACTNPSDSEKYATVPEGNYEAKVGYHRQDYAALRVSDVGTENFYDNSIELGMPNPSDTTTTKAKGINIHMPGSDNLTKFTRTKLPISMGCLLIDIERWDSFIGIFNNHDQRKNTVGILIQR